MYNKARNDTQTQKFRWPLLDQHARANMWKDSEVLFDLTNLNFSSLGLFQVFVKILY
jgi:hypothetical protein